MVIKIGFWPLVAGIGMAILTTLAYFAPYIIPLPGEPGPLYFIFALPFLLTGLAVVAPINLLFQNFIQSPLVPYFISLVLNFLITTGFAQIISNRYSRRKGNTLEL
jgi:hypothetical protein